MTLGEIGKRSLEVLLHRLIVLTDFHRNLLLSLSIPSTWDMGKTESVFLLLLASLMSWLIAAVRSRQPEYPGIPPFFGHWGR